MMPTGIDVPTGTDTLFVVSRTIGFDPAPPAVKQLFGLRVTGTVVVCVPFVTKSNTVSDPPGLLTNLVTVNTLPEIAAETLLGSVDATLKVVDAVVPNWVTIAPALMPQASGPNDPGLTVGAGNGGAGATGRSLVPTLFATVKFTVLPVASVTRKLDPVDEQTKPVVETVTAPPLVVTTLGAKVAKSGVPDRTVYGGVPP